MNITAKSEWRIGDRVTGEYFGKPYSGNLGDATRPLPGYQNMIFQVALAAPIIVFGQERWSLEIWTNSPYNTITTA